MAPARAPMYSNAATLVRAPVPCCAADCSRFVISQALRSSIARRVFPGNQWLRARNHCAALVADFQNQIRIDPVAAVSEYGIADRHLHWRDLSRTERHR